MIRRARITIAAVAASTAVLLLSGCGGSEPAPTVTPTSSASVMTPPPTAAPAPTGTSAPVTLPTDCNALATEATRQETVGDMTLQSNGEGFVRPAPDGATLALGCDWIVGDATGLLLLISTATPEAVTSAVGDLPAQGYSCQVSDDFGADFCTLPGSGENTEEMIVARDGVWIYLASVNRNARAFLSEIATQIFG